MSQKDHKLFIKKAKDDYKKISFVECPAFNGEMVYFNAKGFRHLLYKRNDRRHDYQQQRRLELLKYASVIIKDSIKIVESRDIVSNGSIIKFWSFEKVFNSRLITVVVRQINIGPKHFFSIMDKSI